MKRTLCRQCRGSRLLLDEERRAVVPYSDCPSVLCDDGFRPMTPLEVAVDGFAKALLPVVNVMTAAIEKIAPKGKAHR